MESIVRRPAGSGSGSGPAGITGRITIPYAAAGLVIGRTGITVRQISDQRSEEHTSELQSLMRISYAVFCLKKKIQSITTFNTKTHEILTQTLQELQKQI